MKPGETAAPADLAGEVGALIDTLHATEQRLAELTAGEVDSVADRHGRTFLLRHAQEELRHSEAAKQAAILNALPARVALLDPEGLIISVNEAWRRFSSKNALPGPEYGISLNYLDVCDCVAGSHAAEARQVAAGIRTVLNGAAKSFSLEYACHSPTERRWFLLTVTPVSEERRTGAVIMHSNVTAVRLTEESLRASDLRFRQMAENIRDVFFLVDAASNSMLYVSPAYEEISGRTCESLRANPASWIEAVHPDDRASTRHEFEAGMAAGRFQHEVRVVRPDGSIRWMQARGFPVRDDAGAIIRIAGVAEDITERKSAADELLESERRLSDMLENIELISVMLDCDARITYCNEYLLRLTGWRLEETIGQSWFDRFTPWDTGELKGVFAALLAGHPEARHHENEIVTRSGERRCVRWNNSVLRSATGEVIGAASIGEDITERRTADEVLRKRAAELERFHRLSVGRELQMIELKKQINELAGQAGRAPPYDVAGLGPTATKAQ